MRTPIVCAILLFSVVAALPVAAAEPEWVCNPDFPTYEACEWVRRCILEGEPCHRVAVPPPEPECNPDLPTYEACKATWDLVACLLGDRSRCPE